MRHAPRETRIVRLGDLPIYRVEYWADAGVWKPARWVPLRRYYIEGGSYIWEGSFESAKRERDDFIRNEWETIYRAEKNWIRCE